MHCVSAPAYGMFERERKHMREFGHSIGFTMQSQQHTEIDLYVQTHGCGSGAFPAGVVMAESTANLRASLDVFFPHHFCEPVTSFFHILQREAHARSLT